MWASTHNETLKKKMFAVVSALHDCQNKMGTGYLSAFPSEQFDRFEALKPVWAPYYTIHKVETVDGSKTFGDLSLRSSVSFFQLRTDIGRSFGSVHIS